MKVVKKSKVGDFIKEKNKDSSHLQLMWLGQAGFIFKFNNKLLMIDPYLSDSLAKKYQNQLFPHNRLMDPPIFPNQVYHLDYFLSTHAHTDHMDPETIGPIALNSPDCKFIIPSAVIKDERMRGITEKRIVPVNAHDTIQLDDLISITTIPAAHESIKTNSNGEHFFLGYIFRFNGLNIYHSGDCVPYSELENFLKEYDLHLALLPINGRDEYRLTHGIAGNFFAEEVIDLCEKLKVKTLMVHHFGMFAYNTVSNKLLSKLAEFSSDIIEVIIPRVDTVYQFNHEI